MDEPQAAESGAPSDDVPAARPVVLPYATPSRPDVVARPRPLNAAPLPFVSGTLLSGAAAQLLIGFVAPGPFDGPGACCSVVVAPVASAAIGTIALVVWQVVLDRLRGGGFVCGRDDTYRRAGVLHGVASALAWLAFGVLSVAAPHPSPAAQAACAAPLFVVPFAAPFRLLRRQSLQNSKVGGTDA